MSGINGYGAIELLSIPRLMRFRRQESQEPVTQSSKRAPLMEFAYIKGASALQLSCINSD